MESAEVKIARLRNTCRISGPSQQPVHIDAVLAGKAQLKSESIRRAAEYIGDLIVVSIHHDQFDIGAGQQVGDGVTTDFRGRVECVLKSKELVGKKA